MSAFALPPLLVEAVVDVGLVGLAVLNVCVAVSLYRWIRIALGSPLVFISVQPRSDVDIPIDIAPAPHFGGHLSTPSGTSTFEALSAAQGMGGSVAQGFGE